MGSLMAGWDSKSGRYKKNWSSLTKEDIEAYWKSKKKVDDEQQDLPPISSPSYHTTQEILVREDSGGKFRRSISFPMNNRKEGCMDTDAKINWDNIDNRSGWWTRSNWAFLNEPAVIETHSNSYASQFHVANNAPPPPPNC